MLARAEERVFRILDTKGESQVSSLREVLHESLARIDARMPAPATRTAASKPATSTTTS